MPDPLLHRLDPNLTPEHVAARLQRQPGFVWLDSSRQMKGCGRYSFIACDPFLTLTSRGDQIVLRGEAETRLQGDPLTVLQQCLERYQVAPTEGPLPGAALGYLAYDLGWQLEPLPQTTCDDIGGPDLALGFYDLVYTYDHETAEARLVSTGHSESERQDPRRAAARVSEWLQWVQQPPVERDERPASDGSLRRNFAHSEYLRALQAVKDYIAAGDIYQADLTQRFATDLQVSPWELYLRLRQRNPAPFSAYVDLGGLQVASSSPERFVKLDRGAVETRPIKGTRPRGASPEEDAALAAELAASVKDNAELLMIVDLERNDLGRVCRVGSVHVPELAVLESYETVHHLVATVRGELPAEAGVVDLLRAAFPGGSIVGAPKIRAMEIIDELEPTRRSVYTGAIGYLGFDGRADLNIAIRTVICNGGKAYFQVGGGIVADSDPEAEYQETLDKGRALARALDIPAASFI